MKELLNPKEKEFMKWVVKFKTASAYDLAKHLDISYPTAHSYVKKLSSKGLLVEVGKVDAERGGTKIVYRPTEKGLKLVESIRESTRQLVPAQVLRPVDTDVALATFEKTLRDVEPVFKMLRADTWRELEHKEINFLLDFSEIHDLLHPELAEPYRDVGWVLYMFDEKIQKDKFIFSPPSAWEMLDHMEKITLETDRYADFNALIRHHRMSSFRDVLRNPSRNPKTVWKKVTAAYEKMGKMSELVILADSDMVKTMFPEAMKRLELLVKEKVIIPLDDVLEDSFEPTIETEVYQRVYTYLRWRRILERDEKNIVDALNMALTYQLTDSLYKTDNQYFTLVIHSRRPLEIYSRIKWNDDPLHTYLLYRQPLYMATRVTCREKFRSKQDCIRYFERGETVIHDLLKHRDLLDYSDRFPRAFQRGPQSFLEDELKPFTKMLGQYTAYTKEYAPLISKLININVEKLQELHQQREDRKLRILQILQNKEDYEEHMKHAHETISQSLKDAYRILRNFAETRYGELYKEEMLGLFKRIEKDY